MNNTFTYAGTVLPADKTLDKNELSFIIKPEEFDECVPLFEDGQVMIEHKNHMKCTGTSTKAWKDKKSGDLKVATTVSLDDEYGRMVRDGVKAGKLRGLSFRGTSQKKPGFLKMSEKTGLWEVVPPKVVEYEMTEISVCEEGQLPGSDLNAWVEVDAEGKVSTGVFDYDTKPKDSPIDSPTIVAEVGASKTVPLVPAENEVCTPGAETVQTQRVPPQPAMDPPNVNRTLKRERPDDEAEAAAPPAQPQVPVDGTTAAAGGSTPSDATAQATKKIKYEIEDAEYRELMAFKKEKAALAEKEKVESEKKNRDERKRMAEMLKDSMQALMDQFKNDAAKKAALEKDADDFYGKVNDGADLTPKETSLIAAAVSASRTAEHNNIKKMEDGWKKEKSELEKKAKTLNDQLLYQISLNPTSSRSAQGKAIPAASGNNNWFSNVANNQVSYGNDNQSSMMENTAVPRFNPNTEVIATNAEGGNEEMQTADVGASKTTGASDDDDPEQQQQRTPMPSFDHPMLYENESLRYMATKHNKLYREIRWGQAPSLDVEDMIYDRLQRARMEKQAATA